MEKYLPREFKPGFFLAQFLGGRLFILRALLHLPGIAFVIEFQQESEEALHIEFRSIRPLIGFFRQQRLFHFTLVKRFIRLHDFSLIRFDQ